ncbi:MAG: acetyl-CoA carboxylase biotin carboxyl carrier protein [Gammaproteobacteria bacterium]|jgi:acetyl-CoA carboxylase biotin carboxyl carrier protein|nr:acetyl-CoA carboxylase biotin carboxyl carrier protein [Gammaproteobacteria bacterium]MBL6819419.1 acetyl-CoA carboxylase biotin carboxyl carrier protein [Gammaproteobacteria bacterium]MBL6899037.1 acetyl-CoA carboxylase biotin carboxyl carrier protein [Gammaproteobacteria bacterium]
MDLRKIKKLMELLEESGIAEIEVKEGEESIKLSRNTSSLATPVQQVMQQPVFAPQQQSTEAVDSASTIKETKVSENKNTVNSPMVGTFYASASPESKPFVTVGQTVKKGDTLCILEAMKMMNQVQAETDGKILEILVDNAEPVEFDQPLFVIE